MLKDIKLAYNYDGTYDIVIEYEKNNAEFALEFNSINDIKTNSQKIIKFIKSNAKNLRIASVRIMLSGALVATIAFSAFTSIFAATNKYSMGYLYSGTDQQHIEYVNRTNGALDTVSPSYFDIQDDGSLKLNYLSQNLINTMHSQGVKVVPFLSNHWNRTAGINALKDVELLSTQIADYVEEYNLDGVNVDIENVTHEQRDQYTEFVRLLREKIPSYKEVSVAVAANPNDWQTGWHGSYDYTELSKYADHLFIMTYDEHYEGGDAGPVASIDFVENSIKYALSKTTADKIVLGIPLYGRVWSLDSNRIVGKGISIDTINDILKNCSSTVTYDESSQSVKAEFEITESSAKYTVGGDFVLNPGKYVVWYENDQSYSSKLNLVSKYDIKGAGSWSLGQEDPSIWNNYDSWISGSTSDNTPSTPDNTTPPDNDNTQNPTPPENNESQLPPSSENSSQEAIINPNESDVKIYKNKNLTGNVIATLSGGDTITIIKNLGDGVYQVKLSDGQIGYVSSNYVSIKGEESETNTPEVSVPSNPSQEYIIHVVQSGDSLWKIAKQYLGSGTLYPQIQSLNNLTSDKIYPGMQLKIPNSQSIGQNTPITSYTEYNVKKGDSLWKIAKNQLGNGNRYHEIKEINGLTEDTIYPGQVLKLPSK